MAEQKENENRIKELEIRMTYLEQALEELDTVVTKWKTDSDRQAAEIVELREQLLAGGSPLFDDPQKEPPPPHY